MTREQAIHSLIAHGLSVGQVGEIIKAVTPQLSSELEKNSKKLEKDFGELDCISRADAIRVASGYCHPSNVAKELAKLPSVTPQEPTIKALGEELRKAREGIADEKVLIGYNMAVAICNKHLGGSEVDNGNVNN